MVFKSLVCALLIGHAVVVSAVPLGSRHAIVIDEQTGGVLLEKNATDIVPIASVTKLMTAMVVLDAQQDMNEAITIQDADVDTLKFSSSRVPVGAVLTRQTLLELALMSSDNRAASALGRAYPGGLSAFRRAAREKAMMLDMRRTYIEEPTGLSPHNTSTAADLAKLVSAAAKYPEIAQLSTTANDIIDINGNPIEYRNTNRLVGAQDWDILLSKTGFTHEAGRCLVMRVRSAGRHVIMVLLNSSASAARTMDAINLSRFVNGEPVIAAVAPAARRAVRTKRTARASVRQTAKAGAAKAQTVRNASVRKATRVSVASR